MNNMIKNTEYANKVIAAYGGVAALANSLGYKRCRVQSWLTRGISAEVLLMHKRAFDLRIRKQK